MRKILDSVQSFIEFNYFDNEFIESCEKESKAEIINKAIKKLDSAEKINKELQQRNEVLEKENQKYKKEVSKLETENKELKDENRSLIYRLNELFQLLKKFLRKLLQRGNDYTKDETAEVVKDCYDNSEFDMGDVIKISKGTTKQDELFEYVDAPDYYKERVRDYDEYDYDKDDFDLSR